jgi:hypothetical protein
VKELIKPLLIKLLIIDAILLATAIVLSLFVIDFIHLPGMIIGIVLTTANAIAAVVLAAKGMKGSMNDFMLKVVGGMGLRLGALLVIVFLLLAFTNIPEFSFIISLFISYICKSVLEIIFVIKIRNQSQLLSK